jgi:branched-chain amino acid transport system substrate-binding protein
MNITQIGLLLPSSTIFPIGKDFEKGLIAGLGEHVHNFSLVKEFIGQGMTKKVEEAIDKLIGYDEVDVITGIVSAKVVEAVAPKFAGKQKPFLVSDLGEYIVDLQKLNEYVFINSHHYWRHAWAMGNWGVQHFGKKGMFIGSIYDTAYNFSNMFYEGMMAADPTAEWSFSVTPNPPPGQLSDMSVIFPFLEQYQPDFVFAAFCGTESTLFLNEFIRKGWHKRTRLTGLPFLLSPFTPLEDDITIYTTLPDAATPDMNVSESFYKLGFRAGKTIAKTAHTENVYAGLLSDEDIMPLGNAHFVMPPEATNDIITITENSIQANNPTIEQKVIDSTTAFALTGEGLNSLLPELSSGWLNPYLCI